MLRAAVLALAAVFALPGTVGAETTADSPPVAAPPQPADQSSPVTVPEKTAPGQRLLTPEQEGRQGIVKGVVNQSFRDFGLMQSKIPPVLIEAMGDPYARVSPATCDQLATEIRRLEFALGPDLDAPINTERLSNFTRGKGQARDAALDAMRSTVQDYIPFDGYIRIVSGASTHDHRVLAAIQAGSVRRAYLKGMGEAQGCAAPATPRHLAHPVSVATEQPPAHGR